MSTALSLYFVFSQRAFAEYGGQEFLPRLYRFVTGLSLVSSSDQTQYQHSTVTEEADEQGPSPYPPSEPSPDTTTPLGPARTFLPVDVIGQEGQQRSQLSNPGLKVTFEKAGKSAKLQEVTIVYDGSAQEPSASFASSTQPKQRQTPSSSVAPSPIPPSSPSPSSVTSHALHASPQALTPTAMRHVPPIAEVSSAITAPSPTITVTAVPASRAALLPVTVVETSPVPTPTPPPSHHQPITPPQPQSPSPLSLKPKPTTSPLLSSQRVFSLTAFLQQADITGPDVDKFIANAERERLDTEEVVLNLSNEDLIALGLSRMGDRKRFLTTATRWAELRLGSRLPAGTIIKTEELTVEEPPLGQGNFAAVYKGTFNAAPVGVKVLFNLKVRGTTAMSS